MPPNCFTLWRDMFLTLQNNPCKLLGKASFPQKMRRKSGSLSRVCANDVLPRPLVLQPQAECCLSGQILCAATLGRWLLHDARDKMASTTEQEKEKEKAEAKENRNKVAVKRPVGLLTQG